MGAQDRFSSSAYFCNPQPTRGPKARKLKTSSQFRSLSKADAPCAVLGSLPLDAVHCVPRVSSLVNLVISTEFQALRARGSDVSPQASRAFPTSGSVTRCPDDFVSSQMASLSTFGPPHCGVGEPLKDTRTGTNAVEIQNTANSPALWPGDRWRLRHPSVVASSSFGCVCTGKKGQHLMYGVQQAADPAIGPYRDVSPGSSRGPGRLHRLKCPLPCT